MRLATQLLAGKLMRKCRANKVSAFIIALAEQCTEGVQFNWAQFLCDESLTNCHEAQEKGKTFHYAWFLLTILLVAGELPEGSQFPDIEKDVPKVVWYNLLQATKDAARIREIKVFWIFMEASIWTRISRKPRLSLTVYNWLQSMAEFKADMHNLYIQVRKDPTRAWVKLLFIATDNAIF